jgi:hypothetical protein
MPIAGKKPDALPPAPPEVPRVEPKDYKSVIFDDNHVPLQSLIAFVEGAPWTVDYYAQVTAAHNDLRVEDSNQSAVYQQYQKFLGLEIRVDSALTSTTDENTQLTTVSGSGNMYPFMKPNKGDMFITDTADNKKAKFVITQVNRKTFTRDSAWQIQYVLKEYVDETSPEHAALEDKVVRTYHFSKQRLMEGLQPFIKSAEYENVTNLNYVFKDIVRYYFANFFNVRYSTFVLPGQESPMYDSGLVNYLMQMVSTDDAEEVRDVRRIPTDQDPYLNQPEFWRMMLDRDYAMRAQCNRVFGLVHKNGFNRNTYLDGVRHSTIQYLVYPSEPDQSLNVLSNPLPKTLDLTEVIDTTGFKGTTYSSVDNTFVDTDGSSYDIIHEVLVDDSYVLSDAFYDATDEQSLLEILVKDYLKGQAINLNKLYACCNVFKKWKRLEQFYYGPILLTLLLEANRAQYT